MRSTTQFVSLLALLAVCSIAVPSHAQQDVFDRGAEIDRHIATFKDGTRGAVIEAGQEIVHAGLSDPKLSAAIAQRLRSEPPLADVSDKVGASHYEWMIRALASTGNADYKATILESARRSRNYRVASDAGDEVGKIEWYRTRNDIMASRRYHNEGDDPRVSRLLNLLMAEDFSFKLFAAERMNREQMLEPKLIEAVNKQVLQYMDSTARGAPRDQAKAVGMYVKLLGYSGNVAYRDTLQKVLASKASSQTKKHAKEALGRLLQ
jgi:hypothetical protein